MNRRKLCLLICTILMSLGLFTFAACGADGEYEGVISFGSKNAEATLELDSDGTCTLIAEGYLELGGVYEKDGSKLIFKTLSGTIIATGEKDGDDITLYYGNYIIEFTKI